MEQPLLSALETAVPKLHLLPGETVTKKRMFGGVCILLNGKMLAGVTGDRLVIRLEAAEFEEASKRGEVSPMDFTGRPLRNFAYVEPFALESEVSLMAWLEMSMRYVRLHMLK